MDARKKSLLKAVGAGVALGGIALAARYAPAAGPLSASPFEKLFTARTAAPGGGPAPAGAAMTPAAPAPLMKTALPSGVAASAGAALQKSPAIPVDRYADAASRAACPADMTLVDGDFCPELRYACARSGDGAGYGCPEYARGARCTEPTDPRRFCIDRYEWPNRIGEVPRVYVDWGEAKANCASAGKRLCRRSEWILACEGPKRLPYPWGFVRAPSPCNIDRASIDYDIAAILDEATRDQEIARLWQADPIGSHPDCVSSFGAYDLSGNVDEWTDNLADDPHTRHPATLNGGYWGPVRNTCRLTTDGHSPTFKFYQVGFRCCGDTIDGIATPPPKPFVEREPPAGGARE